MRESWCGETWREHVLGDCLFSGRAVLDPGVSGFDRGAESHGRNYFGPARRAFCVLDGLFCARAWGSWQPRFGACRVERNVRTAGLSDRAEPAA